MKKRCGYFWFGCCRLNGNLSRLVSTLKSKETGVTLEFKETGVSSEI